MRVDGSSPFNPIRKKSLNRKGLGIFIFLWFMKDYLKKLRALVIVKPFQPEMPPVLMPRFCFYAIFSKKCTIRIICEKNYDLCRRWKLHRNGSAVEGALLIEGLARRSLSCLCVNYRRLYLFQHFAYLISIFKHTL